MYRWTLKRVVRYGAVGLFGLLLLYFALYQFRALREGPMIDLIGIEHGASTSTPLLSVSGSVKNARSLTLNDRSVLFDLKGAFAEKLLLSPGYNIISLIAEDVRGRTTEVRREIVYISGQSGTSTPAEKSATTSATEAR